MLVEKKTSAIKIIQRCILKAKLKAKNLIISNFQNFLQIFVWGIVRGNQDAT